MEDAVGQYVVYRIALQLLEPDRQIYLAAPEEICVNFENAKLWKAFVQVENAKILGYDLNREEIVKWLP